MNEDVKYRQRSSFKYLIDATVMFFNIWELLMKNETCTLEYD